MDPNIGKAKASKTLERFIPNPKRKLLDPVSEVMRLKRLARLAAWVLSFELGIEL